MGYGEMLRIIRVAKEMTLRELSARTDVDIAYISRVERETIPPPQNEEILDSINLALELDNTKSQEMKDQAAIDNKMIPMDVATIKGVPLLLRTVANKKPNEDQMRKIIAIINEEY